jgi:methionyl-tRNA synthetase
MPGKYYITTAIDYVNSAPHVGTAYEKISADVFARFHRLAGDDVYFQMGNDEHSLNVERAARAKGMDPKAYCDEMEKVFRGIWRKLDVSFDRFVRTTDEDHVRGLTKLFQVMRDDIYQGHYEGHYCESCEAFLLEKDLVEGNCPTHRTKPAWIKEENYFFRLTKYRDRLLAHIEEHPEFIQPETRRNEIVQLLKGGLSDISVSRAGTTWGVPLPMDESQVIYVWVDALTNYITGAGYGTDEARFAKLWPADLHLIGKDITRFHCVIWPAMLMSAGIALPKTVYGHGFVYFKGQRLSKSRGVTVDPLEAADMFGPSALRYFLMREGTYGRDVDFTWEQFRARYDSELANDLGNLVSRAIAMVEKFLGGRVPNLTSTSRGYLRLVAEEIREPIIRDMTNHAPHSALARTWELVRRANSYIEEAKPWALAREDSAKLAQTLFDVVEAIRQVAVLAWPVMPAKCEEILSRFGVALSPGAVPIGDLLSWGHGWPETIETRGGAPVFPKYNDAELAAKFDVVGAGGDPGRGGTGEAPGATPAAKGARMVSFQEFQSLDLRLARVVEASRVEGASKLLKLSVDLGGGDLRQIVAGVAAGYAPEALVGKTIVVVANLEPARIRGIESQAMLLAAVGEKTIALLVPDKELPAGTKVS